ncbi:quinohemoprotein amine dehydrogenase subunit alpha [Neptuniibacter sp.]|uniref:quinohemoprotein amine dehydrogenase subunit alpha n=1 Tax=Neptuniibacter sp. TaxID=1962643 RepID=UPI002605269B|nr:quinohemoprotein amine dehydrogenase subunit alpha [Neptuniibacter sp.]
MNKQSMKRVLSFGGAVAFLGLAAQVSAMDGEQIIKDNCLQCHSETGDSAAPFSRISQQRKTPESWQATINRMKTQRGLKISKADEKVLLKYLADNQGLAPSETMGLRYVLEREPNVVEQNVPQHVAEMCLGCHSSARSGLQRRSQDEWEKLVHFHLGQFPSLEYTAGARNIPWFDIAINDTSKKLAADYPLKSQAWDDWKKAAKADLKGDWAVSGYMPDKGEYSATLSIMPNKKDEYILLINGHYADGSKLSGSGSAVVYNGYEWRASIIIDGREMRQVFAASADGKALSGRMFLSKEDAIGGYVNAKKVDKAPTVVAVSPTYVKRGETTKLRITGTNLDTNIDLGKGVKAKLMSKANDHLIVEVTVDAKAATGVRSVSVAGSELAGALAVYDKLARVEVTPSYSIARVGGAGAGYDKEKSLYRAVGYSAGKDGKAGTADDVKLGFMPATWTLQPFDEVAEHDNDLKYAGTIDANGIFTPGGAGPNAERKMSTNNAGNLKVIGTVADGANKVAGESQLIVTAPDLVREFIR